MGQRFDESLDNGQQACSFFEGKSERGREGRGGDREREGRAGVRERKEETEQECCRAELTVSG